MLAFVEHGITGFAVPVVPSVSFVNPVLKQGNVSGKVFNGKMMQMILLINYRN